MANCMRSKLVGFHTKSTEKLSVKSVGTFSLLRSSSPTSSDTSASPDVSSYLSEWLLL